MARRRGRKKGNRLLGRTTSGRLLRGAGVIGAVGAAGVGVKAAMRSKSMSNTNVGSAGQQMRNITGGRKIRTSPVAAARSQVRGGKLGESATSIKSRMNRSESLVGADRGKSVANGMKSSNNLPTRSPSISSPPPPPARRKITQSGAKGYKGLSKAERSRKLQGRKTLLNRDRKSRLKNIQGHISNVYGKKKTQALYRKRSQGGKLSSSQKRGRRVMQEVEGAYATGAVSDLMKRGNYSRNPFNALTFLRYL